MSKIGYNQKGNPFKQTLGTNTARGGSAYGGNAFHKNTRGRSETKEEQEARNKRGSGLINYLDMNDDGKASPWEVGVEVASWIPTAIAAFGGTMTTGVGGVPAAAATKVGFKQLVKGGIKKSKQLWNFFAKNPKTTIGGTVGGKTVISGGRDIQKEYKKKKGDENWKPDVDPTSDLKLP
tara:strand:+ start:74 stop:610 length:537 start_codon:yes stop_codon:yes gene_type:complete